METETLERSRVQKLSGPNYRNWALQVQMELIDKKVWSAIDPSFVLGLEFDAPGKEESAEAAEVRKKQIAFFCDNRARRIIVECCTVAVIARVIRFKTAIEVWDELKDIYAREGLQQLDEKNEAFASYRPPTTTSVVDVAVMLSELQDEIGEMDIEQRPGDSKKSGRFLAIMAARGDKYDIAATQVRMAEVTDFRKIVRLFADIEDRTKAAKSVVESARQASTDEGDNRGKKAWRRRDGGRGKPSEKDTRTCYHCGKTGHIRQDCRSKQRGEPKSAGPSTGPLAAPGGGRGLSPPPSSEEANLAGAQVAPITQTSWVAEVDDLCGVNTRWASDTQVHSKAWIMDSGCSRHMTYAREAFVDYSILSKPIQVRLANGTEIQAVAEGTVSFEIAVQGGRRRIQLHEVLHVPKLAGSLVSVSHLQDRGIMTRTTRGGKMLLELRDEVIGVANRVGRSYILDGT